MADIDTSGWQPLGELLGGGAQQARLRGMLQGLQIQDLQTRPALHSAQTEQALAAAREAQAKATGLNIENDANQYLSGLPPSAFADPNNLPMGKLLAGNRGTAFEALQRGRQLGQEFDYRALGGNPATDALTRTRALGALAGKPYSDLVPIGAGGVTNITDQNPSVTTTPLGESIIDRNKATAAAAAARAKNPANAPFTPEQGEILAALTERGISLPAGFRSRQQIQATLDSLIARNPGASADDIADKVLTGQIDLGATKKATTTAAATAGRVGVAQNEIGEFAPIVRSASAAVPRGSFMPINRLLQAADTQISDPNLLRLKISINSLLNAYDQLAARGGTDVGKRAEAHSLLTSAQSPEALEAGLQMFEMEAAAAERAAQKAMKRPGGSQAAAPQVRTPAAPTTPSGTRAGPAIGAIEDGYRFKGGNPADPASWEKL